MQGHQSERGVRQISHVNTRSPYSQQYPFPCRFLPVLYEPAIGVSHILPRGMASPASFGMPNPVSSLSQVMQRQVNTSSPVTGASGGSNHSNQNSAHNGGSDDDQALLMLI